MASILIVDDDAELCELMTEFLRANGFDLAVAHDGASGLSRALSEAWSLIILDVMLPILDGYEVLRLLRRRSSLPVIMLTARAEPSDRVTGLEGGADDYLVKPFAATELLARIRSVLRRTAGGSLTSGAAVQRGDLRLEPGTRTVYCRDIAVPVSESEFAILEVLVRFIGRAVSRDELAAVLYQRPATPYERSVDVHVSHLRKKLEPHSRVTIRSARGVGYVLSTGA